MDSVKTLIPNKEYMNTVLLEEMDFFEELTVEDIHKIEKGREQIQQGMSISSEDLQKETREKYGNKMGY